MRALLQTNALSAPPGRDATAPTIRRRALACATGTRLSTLILGPTLGLRPAFLLPPNEASRSALLPIRADSSREDRAVTPAGFSGLRASVQLTIAPSAPESSQNVSSAAFASVSSGAGFAASTAPAIAVPASFQAMAAAAGAPVFTPWSSLFGGVLIGVAATLHLLMSGRIMGASGIINGAISGASDWPFRVAFLVSMLAVGCAAHLALPSAFGAPTFPAPAQDPIGSVILPAVAGVLAGFGSQLGSGCTSGHGVCGLPRLSIRSFVAVCTFMTTGAIASMLSNALLPPVASAAPVAPPTNAWIAALSVSAASLLLLLVRSLVSLPAPPSVAKDEPPKAAVPGAVPPVLLLSSVLSGAVFAVGLTFSGMLNPAKVKAFLDPIHGWDPSLAFVMGGAVLFNLIAFHFVLKQRHPLLAPSFALPTRKEITKELVIGSAIFGLGWGLAGFCPAPALVSAVTGK
ncbi:unnamed protein product, partial [Closterium sp. NIES-64]